MAEKPPTTYQLPPRARAPVVAQDSALLAPLVPSNRPNPAGRTAVHVPDPSREKVAYREHQEADQRVNPDLTVRSSSPRCWALLCQ